MRTIVSIKQFGLRLFTVVAIAAYFASSALAQTPPLVMKIGTATINDSMHQWMKVYAALVEKIPKG